MYFIIFHKPFPFPPSESDTRFSPAGPERLQAAIHKLFTENALFPLAFSESLRYYILALR